VLIVIDASSHNNQLLFFKSQVFSQLDFITYSFTFTFITIIMGGNVSILASTQCNNFFVELLDSNHSFLFCFNL
jgi:hypothetical protein